MRNELPVWNRPARRAPGRLAGVLLVGALLQSACATLSRDECRQADWRTIGFEDGLKGYPALRIGAHRKACARHGVTPDLQRYAEGRDAGLRQFCRPANGYRLGRAGVDYAGVCPAASEPAFLDAYYAGRELHSLEARIDQLDREVNTRAAELEQVNKDIAAIEEELVVAGSTPTVREALLAELRALEREGMAIQEAILAADEERISQQARLSELQQRDTGW